MEDVNRDGNPKADTDTDCSANCYTDANLTEQCAGNSAEHNSPEDADG